MKRIVFLALIVFALFPFSNSVRSVNAACSLAAKAGMSSEPILSSGVSRSYILFIPKSYDGKTALPVVFSYHGFISNPAQQMLFSGWDKIGEREGFFTVYPAGTGNPTRWYSGTTSFTGPETTNDVQFFNDMLDELNKHLCIDNSRIFVTGLSNGGGMSHRLACDTSMRIAAIGTVAGAYPSVQMKCEATRAIPIIAFHGDADKIVNYKGSQRELFPDIQEWAAEWAKRNSCQKGPDEFFKKDDVTAVQWGNCAQNGDVQLYTISDGGHTWPGGGLDLPAVLGKTTKTINASELMWKFFIAHPMPQAP